MHRQPPVSSRRSDLAGRDRAALSEQASLLTGKVRQTSPAIGDKGDRQRRPFRAFRATASEVHMRQLRQEQAPGSSVGAMRRSVDCSIGRMRKSAEPRF
jgi:hypothetical protein